ncbi:CBS domain-containing protein [Desulfobotulus sp. H1]|uniref:CBS domain-containing protein n=1 Tax=Desulfobotulus pelophilus TaxID=2823377 RepID=A0ABT3N950_9BACT|nr:CBS domain-containing protein [Desulfobotulus pelophilus]MCW7753988.1 CBS domain-containing protein [Desulfobotulus pelophilus]
MQQYVKDFMVPIEKFPVIQSSATFTEAVIALEKAQEAFLAGRQEQRILLVRDDAGKIVGKLTPIDIVRGLEPNFDKVVDKEAGAFVSNVNYVIESMKQHTQLWSKPIDDLCGRATDIRVRDFIKGTPRSQVVPADASLNDALHAFVIFGHDAVFAMDGAKVAGVLRFSDVYREIQRQIKTCAVL